MIYRLNFTSQDPKPPHRHYRTGKLIVVNLNGNKLQLERRMPIISEIVENFDLIDGVEIEINYYKNNYEPYPDFLTIDVALYATNEIAGKFLAQLEIEYLLKPVKIVNEQEHEYSLIMFPTKNLINLNSSNVYINEKGKLATIGKNYFDGKLVLNKEAKGLKGIFRLDKLGNVLICDEKTKKSLENSGLIGFTFEELEIS